MDDDLFADYGFSSVKELILAVLIKESRPMRQVELYALIKERYPQKPVRSSGALSLALRDLVGANIVKIKQSEFKKLKYYYANPEYVRYKNKNFTEFLQKIYDNMQIESAPGIETAHMRDIISKPKSDFKFSTLKEADNFVVGILTYLLKFGKLRDRRVIGEILFNRFWLYEADAIKDTMLYLNIKSEFEFNINRTGWLKGKDIRLRLGVDNTVETFVCLTEEANIEIEMFPDIFLCDLIESGVSEEQFKSKLKKYLNMKGDYLVSIKSGDESTLRKRDLMFNSFKKKLFSQMIDNIILGIENKKETIIIDEEFVYLTKEQAEFSRVALDFVNYAKEADIMLEAILHYSLKHFRTDEPITLIDLGVGPAVKQVPIHSVLNKHFDVTNYVAVDSSSNILKLAKENMERFHLANLELEFLQLRFQDITKDPSLLTEKLPSSQRLYLFLGSTYTNYFKEEMFDFINSFMRKGDYILIQFDGMKNSKDAESTISKRYNDVELLENMKKFHCSPLINVGFRYEDLDYHYEFDNKINAALGIAAVKRESKLILPIIDKVKKGQKFRMHLNRKFTVDMLQKEMKELGLKAEITETAVDLSFVALCRKI